MRPFEQIDQLIRCYSVTSRDRQCLDQQVLSGDASLRGNDMPDIPAFLRREWVASNDNGQAPAALAA